jgi:hypothetical protein
MKWLTAFLCLFAVSTFAEVPEIPQVQDPEQKVLPLPTLIQCTEIPPDQMLGNLYGEEVFLFGIGSVFVPGGRTATGEMRMFVSPDEKTYTVMLEIGPLHCMVISGDVKDMFAPEQEL